MDEANPPVIPPPNPQVPDPMNVVQAHVQAHVEPVAQEDEQPEARLEVKVLIKFRTFLYVVLLLPFVSPVTL